MGLSASEDRRMKAEFYIIDMHEYPWGSPSAKARDALKPCYSWRLVVTGGKPLVPLVGYQTKADTTDHAVETLTILGFDEIEEVEAP